MTELQPRHKRGMVFVDFDSVLTNQVPLHEIERRILGFRHDAVDGKVEVAHSEYDNRISVRFRRNPIRNRGRKLRHFRGRL